MRSAQLPDTFTTNLGWSLASLHASMSGLSFELRANGANALIARTSAASTVCTSPSFNNHCGYEYTRGIMELRSVKGKQKLNDVNDGAAMERLLACCCDLLRVRIGTSLVAGSG